MEYSCLSMFLLYSKVNQLYVYVYLFGFPSHLGHHKALSRVPCCYSVGFLLVLYFIDSIHPKGDKSWVFIGRTDAEAETPILWPPDVKSWVIGKDPDAGKDWRQSEKGTTEDEMAGWHHWLHGRESESTLGVGDGQGGLACCDSWGCKESDTTEWLNWLTMENYGDS